jgi:hypothetical protein
MFKTKWIACIVAAAALLTAPAISMAAEHAGPAPYLIVHYDQIEPSMSGEFETNAKEWVEACTGAKLGEEWTWWGYSNAEFGYAWVYEMPDFAYLDGQDAREKAFAEAIGEGKMKELMAGSKAIQTHHTEVLKSMPELSYHPEGFDPAKAGFVRMGIHHVKPAMDEAFQELVKRVVTAFQKAEAPMGFTGYQVAFGNGSYAFATFAESAAQFYSAPKTSELLAKAEGEEASQQMFEDWGNCISGHETLDWQFRPELSYMPEMAAD